MTATAALGCGARSPLDEEGIVSDATGGGTGGGATVNACPTDGPTIVVDGLRVRFLPLPTVDITAGLTPDDLDPTAQFSESGTNDFGATNPFNYSAALDGSTYDAIRGGSATYEYFHPRCTASRFFGGRSTRRTTSVICSAPAASRRAASTEPPTQPRRRCACSDSAYVFESGVHIFVSSDAPIDELEMIGGSDLPFEYANLETSTLACP